MRVLQAIYGDVQSGHDLLACSSANPGEMPVFHRVSLRTGLIDEPPPGTEWRPYIRAFVDGEFYVVTRVFPDASSLRGGMQFAHALFLPLREFCSFGSLRKAINFLATNVNKSMPVPVIEMNGEEPSTIALTGTTAERFTYLIEALVDSDVRFPPIWVGQNDFEYVVAALWDQLPTAVRQCFEFGLVFAKSNLDGRNFTVAVTPEDCASYWPREYRLIRTYDRGGTITPSSGYLLGLPEGDVLRQLETNLETPVSSFDALQALNIIAMYLKESEEGHEGATLAAIRHVGMHVPDPLRGVMFKSQLLSRLADETARGGRSAIWGLRNLPLTPFTNGTKFLQLAISGWVASSIIHLSQTPTADVIGSITDALLQPPPRQNPEWKVHFHNELTNALEHWRSEYADAMWALWTSSDAIIPLLDEHFPNLPAVETALVGSIPSTLDTHTGEQVLALCRNHDWYILHAATAVSSFSPEDAIARHLKYDNRNNNKSALVVLTQNLTDDVVVRSAVLAHDKRLFEIAAARIVRHPDILKEIDLQNSGWQKLLSHSLKAGVVLPAMGGRPTDIVSDILDLLVSDLWIDSDLLLTLSNDPRYSDLSSYTAQEAALARMDSMMQEAFAQSTADGWMKRFEADPSSAPTITGLVKHKITNKQHIQAWFRTPRATPKRVTALLRMFSDILDGELLLSEWIRNYASVNTVEAATIGSLIGERRWRVAANTLVGVALESKYWGAGIAPCRMLVTAFNRFKLSLSGYDSSIEADDWWEAWRLVSTRLFQDGIEDQRIWSIAGGDSSQINQKSAGNVQWIDALRLLRQGGAKKDITVERLLYRMRDAYEYDHDLHGLESMWKQGKVKS